MGTPQMRAEDSWFERGVFREYPDITRRFATEGMALGVWYSTVVRLGRFEPRAVEIFVPIGDAQEPLVYADGPTDSPHRYFVPRRGRIHLCMWYPNDPPARRWRPDDGVLALLGHVRAHLIREAYYREDMEASGDASWLGDEAPHTRSGSRAGALK